MTLAPHEEQFIRRKIWIISLGHRGAARWARAHGLTANQWRHVNSPDDLQGVRDAQILWIGPVWERHDFQRLCDIVDDGVAAGRFVVDRREIPSSGLKHHGKTRTEDNTENGGQSRAAA
jgi:hypothetical protein